MYGVGYKAGLGATNSNNMVGFGSTEGEYLLMNEAQLTYCDLNSARVCQWNMSTSSHHGLILFAKCRNLFCSMYSAAMSMVASLMLFTRLEPDHQCGSGNATFSVAKYGSVHSKVDLNNEAVTSIYLSPVCSALVCG